MRLKGVHMNTDQWSRMRKSSYDRCSNSGSPSGAVSSPLHFYSEQQILDLEDAFLSPGLKHITVATPVTGRELVLSLVSSLYPCARVACLTTHSESLPLRVIRMFDEMAFSGSFGFSCREIDSFLLEQFYYDVLWVECSSDLLAMPWFSYLQNRLLDFNFGATMPILFVFYDTPSLLTQSSGLPE